LDPVEKQQMQDNLQRFFDLANQLDAVDTGHLSPMAHPMDIEQPYRADQVTELTINRETFLALAPKHEAGLYLVSQVIE
jgi:aspartyl-tRNA(Asn)/glutamyl-tRNA(Gln) amidotransferase subunit C